MDKDKALKETYETIAKTLDYNTTASDFQLRELEISTSLKYIKDGMSILDVGCGLGYALTQYTKRANVTSTGIDYAENMIVGARELLQKNNPELSNRISFRQASVMELPFEDASFDVITSHRCLMALLDWGKQKQALVELKRVLKPGGVLVLLEGTFEGLDELNKVRQEFCLDSIDASGKDRLQTLKFHEDELIDFCKPHYDLINTHRFGMYYFISRVVHPLLVAPEAPRYDSKINEIAKDVANLYPEFNKMGHLVGFALKKRQEDN